MRTVRRMAAGAVAAALVTIAAAGGRGEAATTKKATRHGPLAGLPSGPGPTIEKIKALGDNEWVDLGPPAADPTWGRALGRSWSPKMGYAPDLRGAFLAGEGGHGWVNPRTKRQMDDLWVYDIKAHRWTKVKTIWTNNFTPQPDIPKPPQGGDVIACYDAKRDRIYMARNKRLWFYDVQANTWVDPKPTGEFDAQATHDGLMNYDVANDRVVIITLGETSSPPGHKVFVYDPEANTCIATAAAVPKGIAQMNGFYHPVLNVHFVHAATDNREGVMWAYRYRRGTRATPPTERRPGP